jgi:hypothetical protein
MNCQRLQRYHGVLFQILQKLALSEPGESFFDESIKVLLRSNVLRD